MSNRRTLRSGALFGSGHKPCRSRHSVASRKLHGKVEPPMGFDRRSSYSSSSSKKDSPRKHLDGCENKENYLVGQVTSKPNTDGTGFIKHQGVFSTNPLNSCLSPNKTADSLISLLDNDRPAYTEQTLGTCEETAGSSSTPTDALHYLASSSSNKDHCSPEYWCSERQQLNMDSRKKSLKEETMCFFPNCECHGSSTDTLPEVPGEAFFVSLSNDETKELNMIKTVAGTVRVGAGLHKIVHHGHSVPESHHKQSRHNSPVMREMSCFNPPGRSSKNLSGDFSLTAEPGLHVKGRRHWKFEANEELGYDPVADSPIIQNKNNYNYQSQVVDEGTRGNDIDNFDSAFELEERTTFSALAEKLQPPSTEFSDFSIPHVGTPVKVSQFPLMEEILTHQGNSSALTSNSKTRVGLVEPLDMCAIPSNGRSSRKAVSLLKTTSSLSSLPSFLETECEQESNGWVKRSERLRCRSRVRTMAVHQPVISTMKPSGHRCRLKAIIKPAKKKRKAPTHSKDLTKSKTKKRCETPTRNKPKEKLGTVAKATMSREVMDGIVKSIEETVLRVTQEEHELELQQSQHSGDNVCASTEGAGVQNEASIYKKTPPKPSILNQEMECEVSITKCEMPLRDSHGQSDIITPTGLMGNSCKKQSKSKVKKSSLISHKSKKALQTGTAKTSESKNDLIIGDGIASPVDFGLLAQSTDLIPDEVERSSTTPGIGKRFRKKTRKAKEALDDFDLFCEDDWLLKKPKTKRKNVSMCVGEPNSEGPRRSRRSSQMGGLMSDPILEEHAFILWASEHRSQLEQQHPDRSMSELDSMLLTRWADVTDSAKARFFYRARDAFSDHDRKVRSNTLSGDLFSADFPAITMDGRATDRDPVFSEFIQLSVNQQRDLLRMWLKFFQKMLSRKEYVEFILGFKRACGKDGGRPKRTRMRCLDPSHYQMLFDMIRLSKPRVLEVYKEKKGKEKKMVSDTYSLMLRQLVSNQPWPHMFPGCRSQLLTEVLEDLHLVPQPSSDSHNRSSGYPGKAAAAGVAANSYYGGADYLLAAEEEDEEVTAAATAAFSSVLSSLKDPWPSLGNATVANNRKESSLERLLPLPSGPDLGLEESDWNVLNTDLAQGLLSQLYQLSELPDLDQLTLDQQFLAPPRLMPALTQPRRSSVAYLHSRRLPSANISAGSSSRYGSPSQGCLLSSEGSSYPKMNIHYLPATGAGASSMLGHHHHSSTSAGAQPHRLGQQRELKDGTHSQSTRFPFGKKDASSMDMHSYSITMSNLLQASSYSELPSRRCIKVHSKSITSQPRMSVHPFQVPIRSLCSNQQMRLHPRAIPVSCSLQQRFASQLLPSAGLSEMESCFSKSDSHHMYHMGSQPSAPSSRLYPQHLGLNSSGPLITSLSPLRGVKSTRSGRGQHCQMVPYRPRMQLMDSGTQGYRKTAHTIPISTTLRPGGSRAQSNMHQIKVCLPTQALKIPIAKLRGTRNSSSYIKGKAKNMNLPPNTLQPFGSLSSCKPSSYAIPKSTSQSVLAKVLSIQVKSEMESLTNASSNSYSCANHNSSALVSTSTAKSVSTSFLNTLRPLPVSHLSNFGHKQSSHVQLMSMVNSTASCQAGDMRAMATQQTAVVISPMEVHRRPLVSSLGINAYSSGTNEMNKTWTRTNDSNAKNNNSYKISSSNNNNNNNSSQMKYNDEHNSRKNTSRKNACFTDGNFTMASIYNHACMTTTMAKTCLPGSKNFEAGMNKNESAIMLTERRKSTPTEEEILRIGYKETTKVKNNPMSNLHRDDMVSEIGNKNLTGAAQEKKELQLDLQSSLSAPLSNHFKSDESKEACASVVLSIEPKHRCAGSESLLTNNVVNLSQEESCSHSKIVLKQNLSEENLSKRINLQSDNASNLSSPRVSETLQSCSNSPTTSLSCRQPLTSNTSEGSTASYPSNKVSTSHPSNAAQCPTAEPCSKSLTVQEDSKPSTSQPSSTAPTPVFPEYTKSPVSEPSMKTLRPHAGITSSTSLVSNQPPATQTCLSHLLSTDSPVVDVTGRCTCSACLAVKAEAASAKQSNRSRLECGNPVLAKSLYGSVYGHTEHKNQSEISHRSFEKSPVNVIPRGDEDLSPDNLSEKVESGNSPDNAREVTTWRHDNPLSVTMLAKGPTDSSKHPSESKTESSRLHPLPSMSPASIHDAKAFQQVPESSSSSWSLLAGQSKIPSKSIMTQRPEETHLAKKPTVSELCNADVEPVDRRMATYSTKVQPGTHCGSVDNVENVFPARKTNSDNNTALPTPLISSGDPLSLPEPTVSSETGNSNIRPATVRPRSSNFGVLAGTGSQNCRTLTSSASVKRPSLSFQVKKRAHYIHEYLPT